METETLQPGVLFDPRAYPEPNPLTSAQWEQLAKRSSVKLRKRFEAHASALLHPLLVLAERSGIALPRTDGSILTILQEMVRNRTTFWQWNQEDWRQLLSRRLLSRPYVAAVAYHFGGSREPVIFAMAGTYAEAIFGSGVFLNELARLRRVLRSLGYAEALESKASIRRYLEEVPLSADERGIVEGDLAKVDGLIRKLASVPCLDGRTPIQISASRA